MLGSLNFKTKCSSKRVRCYSAGSNNDLKCKYSRLCLFLPAYLLAGFPKTFLTLSVLLLPFQPVSGLLLTVASLPAMIQLDTFGSGGKAPNLTSQGSYKVCHWPVADVPSSKLTSFYSRFHQVNLSYTCQQTASYFLTTCWLCLGFPMTVPIPLSVSLFSALHPLQTGGLLLRGAFFSTYLISLYFFLH